MSRSDDERLTQAARVYSRLPPVTPCSMGQIGPWIADREIYGERHSGRAENAPDSSSRLVLLYLGVYLGFGLLAVVLVLWSARPLDTGPAPLDAPDFNGSEKLPVQPGVVDGDKADSKILLKLCMLRWSSASPAEMRTGIYAILSIRVVQLERFSCDQWFGLDRV